MNNVGQASRPVAVETGGRGHRFWWSVIGCEHGCLTGSVALETGRTDHRFWWSVTACEHGSLTDDKRRSSVPLWWSVTACQHGCLTGSETGQEACPT
jgi:hypothetical protein